MSSARLSSSPRRFAAAAVAVALAVAGLVAIPSVAADAAESGSVSGRVFRDFNANGKFDTGNGARTGIANDLGLAGVTVTAYDAENKVFDTDTSVANGTYTISGTNAASSKLRIEFTGLPAGYYPAPVYNATGDNGTSVQFVTIGATGVNFSVNAPGDYSQSNAPLVTAIQYAGGTVTGKNYPAVLDSPSVVAQPYSLNVITNTSNSAGGTWPGRTTLATFRETGAIWGSAFQASTKSVFVAATYKRQAGLGPLGLGGIYRITDALDASGAPSAAGSVVPFVDVTTLGINVGTALSNDARLLGNADAPAEDADAFAKAGKVGIGGVAISENGKILYFVNLFDRKLYALDISASAPTLIGSYDLGLSGNERPWALKLRGGLAYVGYVDSGESLGGGVAASVAGMEAHVISAPVADLTNWSGDLLNASSLGYPKGDTYSNNNTPYSHQWNSWTDTWGFTGGEVSDGGWQIYPQPILSGLYWDEDGYLSLGFADRTALQGGNRNWSAATGTYAGFYETGSSGDIRIAAPKGDGTYDAEVASVVGTRSGTAPTAVAGNQPEFYGDGKNRNTETTHTEVALGSLAGIVGTREVVSTEFDPLSGIRLSGLGWLNTVNGAGVAGYEQTADGGGAAGASGTFQKGGGLGALQLLALNAPIEIGNRVWFDADQDGKQDADEPALPGVTVQLLKDGVVIGTRTTDASGNYYFSSDPSSPYYVTGGGFVPSGGDYVVKFIAPTTGDVPLDETTFGKVPWSIVTFTDQNIGGGSTDSNPNPATGTTTYTAGSPGIDDHTIDAGFVAKAVFTVSKKLTGAGLAKFGEKFVFTATASDFRGAPLSLGTATPITLEVGQTSAPVTVPVGTKVAVTENDASKYKAVTISPSTAVVVSGTAATPFVFTVTNELFEPGLFSVRKAVTGAVAAKIEKDETFTVKYTYPGLAKPKTVTIKNDGSFVKGEQIPFGTVVTLTEADPDAVKGVGWRTPKWKGEGVTDNGDGTATVTIRSNVNVEIVLTNAVFGTAVGAPGSGPDDESTTESTPQTLASTGLALGGSIAAMVLLILAGLAIMLWPRRRKQRGH